MSSLRRSKISVAARIAIILLLLLLIAPLYHDHHADGSMDKDDFVFTGHHASDYGALHELLEDDHEDATSGHAAHDSHLHFSVDAFRSPQDSTMAAKSGSASAAIAETPCIPIGPETVRLVTSIRPAYSLPGHLAAPSGLSPPSA
jgi:hypothetical protein